MIYFVQPVTGGPVKIGCSIDVDARVRQLESYYSQPLALLGTMPGGRDEEREVHERFSHLRFGRTEQFRPAAELMAFIGRPLLVSANPEAVEVMPHTRFRTLGIRMSDAYADWLTLAASRDRSTVAGFLDRAAADRAKALGLDVPPPERIP